MFGAPYFTIMSKGLERKNISSDPIYNNLHENKSGGVEVENLNIARMTPHEMLVAYGII